MGVFTDTVATGGGFFREAAIAAAHELGVLDALLREPRSCEALAAALGLATAHRLGALLDVMCAYELLARDGDRYRVASAPARVSSGAAAVPREGWGRLGEVIRRDRPLAIVPGSVAGYHRHLVRAGADAAREVAPFLRAPRLLDLGAGAGTYAAAYLDAVADGRATVVDSPEVIALATDELARYGDRVQFVAGDARAMALAGFDRVLLANVLHLHGAAACAELCVAAARAVAPGGAVVVIDLRVDEDRRGPLESLLFALGMKVYTADGDVHPTSRLRGWLATAGLVDVIEHRLASTPEAVVVVGHAPARAR